jgi:hypothetical protein
MTSRNDRCPFKIGEYVIYHPSSRGMALDVMGSPSQKLIPGKTYKVRAIEKDLYIAVEGYDHPGGGLYWTEFESTGEG